MMVNLPCLKGSCPNFLRPTCSYTECPLSFQTGSCPTEGTTAGYSSCLYIDFTDLLFYIKYGYSVDAFPYIVFLVFVLMQCLFCTPSLSGFFPEPCPISESSGTRQGSGINRIVDCLMLQLFLLFQVV